MKRLLFLVSVAAIMFSCEGCPVGGYGKYGQCQGVTKKGNRCKNNAGKTGYCGKHD